MKLNISRWLPLFLLLGIPAVVQAQFTFTTNNETITVTGYHGPGGAVVIPDMINGSAVTEIGDNAFVCQPFTSITIPNSVIGIGYSAFSACSLTNVSFGTNLTTIGNGAFGLTRLPAVTIPASVTNIGTGAFGYCASLTNIAVDPVNSNYTSVGGVLFTKAQTSLVEFPGGMAGTYAISSSVTNIGESAFRGCYALTNIIIPFGVISIGDSTFFDCNGLTSLVIPASVVCIDGSAFASCQNLTKVYFQGVPPLTDGSLFYGDPFYLMVYYLPETLGWGTTFNGRITAAGSVWPFSFATNVNGTISITGYGGAWDPLTIPATINNLPVTSIEDGAFANSPLSAVILPDSVTNIGNNAFNNCSYLTNVFIGANVQTIGDSAFASCYRLTTIILPDTVDYVGNYAFSMCVGLTDAVLGTNVTSIGEFTFYDCYRLTNVTFRGSITNIGDSAFEACSSLTDVALPLAVVHIGNSAFAFCDHLANIKFPHALTTIGVWAFCRCIALTSVTLHAGVTDIGEGAFVDCHALTNVIIPNGVINIDAGAFQSCSSLGNIIVPASVTNLGSFAFGICLSLTNIDVDPANSHYTSADGVLFTKDQARLVQFPSGLTGGYVIPSLVTNIQDGAFFNCSLTSIGIPASTIGIGYQAFTGSASLVNIAVDSTNPGYSSANGVLFDKYQTLLIQVPGAFTGSYPIPATVTRIEDTALYACAGLTSVTIPAGVTSIGILAFAACGSLTNILVDSLNPNYSSLAGVLLNQGKTKLIQFPAGLSGNYSVPDGVTNLGAYSFFGCLGLTNLTIPASVRSLDEYPFSASSNLQGIYFKGDVLDQGSLDYLLSNFATIYYLPGTTGWDQVWMRGLRTVLWNPVMQTTSVNFGPYADGFEFNIAGTPNIPMVIEASTNIHGVWVPLQSLSLTNGSLTFSDPQRTNHPYRFYRLRSP